MFFPSYLQPWTSLPCPSGTLKVCIPFFCVLISHTFSHIVINKSSWGLLPEEYHRPGDSSCWPLRPEAHTVTSGNNPDWRLYPRESRGPRARERVLCRDPEFPQRGDHWWRLLLPNFGTCYHPAYKDTTRTSKTETPGSKNIPAPKHNWLWVFWVLRCDIQEVAKVLFF